MMRKRAGIIGRCASKVYWAKLSVDVPVLKSWSSYSSVQSGIWCHRRDCWYKRRYEGLRQRLCEMSFIQSSISGKAATIFHIEREQQTLQLFHWCYLPLACNSCLWGSVPGEGRTSTPPVSAQCGYQNCITYKENSACYAFFQRMPLAAGETVSQSQSSVADLITSMRRAQSLSIYRKPFHTTVTARALRSPAWSLWLHIPSVEGRPYKERLSLHRFVD